MQQVVVFVILRSGHLLVEKRSNDDEHSPGAFRFPAGHVEKNETLNDALHREVQEELKVQIDQFYPLYQTPFTGADQVERDLHYYVVVPQGEITMTPSLRWFSFRHRNRMNFAEDRMIFEMLLR